MWEILAGTGVFIPVPARELCFGTAQGRADIARRLVKCFFFTETEIVRARSAGNLKDGAIIIPANICKLFC